MVLLLLGVDAVVRPTRVIWCFRRTSPEGAWRGTCYQSLDGQVLGSDLELEGWHSRAREKLTFKLRRAQATAEKKIEASSARHDTSTMCRCLWLVLNTFRLQLFQVPSRLMSFDDWQCSESLSPSCPSTTRSLDITTRLVANPHLGNAKVVEDFRLSGDISCSDCDRFLL